MDVTQRGDELRVVVTALFSVVIFLEADDAVARSGLTRPLRKLLAALRDRMQGATSPLLFSRPRKRGRPKDVSFMGAHGVIAVAVDVLIEGGETKQAAARFVAAELRSAEIRPGGETITAREVLQWRDEIGGGAPELAERTYKDMRTRVAKLPPEAVATTTDRRALVRGIILAIRSQGF